MMGAVTITHAAGLARVTARSDLPLGAMVIGQPVTDAAKTLPRLFNLCRMAQGLAAEMALGLPPTITPADLRAEIIRDHLARLCVILPPHFGLPLCGIPSENIGLAMFGPKGQMPETLAGLGGWMQGPALAAPLVAAVERAFGDGAALVPPLPFVTPATALNHSAQENSAAARVANHPLMQAVAAKRGRGPLWRILGLCLDLHLALQDRLPAPTLWRGVALVPAARGLYALRIGQSGGRVTSLARATPADHLLAPDGALCLALKNLAPEQQCLAPGLIALHDPCVPVHLHEVAHA